MSLSRYRPVAALLLCAHLGSCTTWQPVQVSPRQFIEAESPYKIRFRDQSGAWVPVSYPRVEGDTISGTTPGKSTEDGKRSTVRVRMAARDLPPIEAKRINVPQTIISSVTVTSVVVGAILCATRVVCGTASSVPY